MSPASVRSLGLELLALAFATFALGMAARTGPDPAPVHADPPSSTSCSTPTSAAGADQAGGRPWVDADPTAGVAVWRPGLNVHPCRLVTTRLDPDHARRFAEAARHARPIPASTYSCPMEDGSGVDVYLAYGDGQDEVVHVALSGCGGISAPGRETWAADVREVLRPFPHHLHDLGPARHRK